MASRPRSAAHVAVISLALAPVLGCPQAARAQDAGATAESLFAEGMRLASAGKTEEACRAFEASQKIDPAAGTLLHLADCWEHMGRTASAWSRFRDAASVLHAASDKREQVATDRAAALEKRLVRVKLEVPTASRVPGLALKRDGAVVPDAAWGLPVAVDPGDIKVEAAAPGRNVWMTSVDARKEGDVVVVTIPLLADAPVAASASPAAAGPPAEAWSGRRTAAVIAGGVGVIGVAVGAIFGLRASSKWSDAKNHHCNAGLVCDPSGGTLASDAKSAGNVATIAFLVGGVGLAAGATLWLLPPSSREGGVGVVPSVAPGAASLSLRGGF